MKRKQTAEDLMAAQLEYAGYSFQREFEFAKPKRKWRSDFYIWTHDKHLLVEVDGISYNKTGGRHQTGIGFQGDCEKINEAVVQGYAVLRVTPAMVRGKAKRSIKGKPLMESAIDTIDRFILGLIPPVRHEGYAADILRDMGYIDKIEDKHNV